MSRKYKMVKRKIIKSTQIMGNAESSKVEWKPSLSQINEIIETIAGFSNTEGGKVFVGVDGGGRVIGVQIGKERTAFTKNSNLRICPKN